MSGELQTIPARHGVATFVPRGRTIKVINTYGKQVVSMWAFSLGPPPEDEEEGEAQEVDDEAVQEEAEGLKNAIEQGGGKETAKDDVAESSKEEAKERTKEDPASQDKNTEEEGESAGKETESTEKETDKTNDDEDPPEEAPDTPENEKSSESTSKQAGKRTWASYLPSIPYRNKGAASKPKAEEKPNPEDEKAQNEANTKKWSSYLPTGKGFSSYVPNVQIPESKDVVNAFKTTHSRDPNKSYAEQLYDFSKTPVGAGTIAAATGSGYASSVYAAYSAYASTHPSSANLPPMEYLSLPHTRASTHKLVPEADDEMLTNLRNPIVTLVEDTSPGAHDTLTAACDANLYRSLGVDKPEEHPSCAVNLVLALKELNESAGLKGAKAIGADITVNIAPTPLHLFMNAPVHVSDNKAEGAGAKGITLAVEEPKGKKRAHVRFRAERDVVIVFSACPMDVGNQNGGRCMAANFMVEDVQEGEDLAASISSLKQGQRKAPKKLNGKPSPKRVDEKMDNNNEKTAEKKDDKAEAPKRPEPVKRKSLPRKLSGTGQADANKKAESKKDETIPEENADASTPTKDDKTGTSSEEQKPKKKPKKLQVRSGGASTPAKSS